MKKRTIISLILVIICIIATNKIWLDFKPLPITFDISGNGNCKVTAVFSKKNNNKFVVKKTKQGSTETKLTNTPQTLRIDVKRVKRLRRVKLLFSKMSVDNSNIVISNIQIKNGELKLDNLKNFKAKNATIKIDNDKLIISPSNTGFSLIYDAPVKISADIAPDIFILISIIILTFLLSYKLTSYLANFKNIQKQSRIEIMFLIIFLIFLFIPMSHINQDEKAKGENRYLAKLKPFIENNQINYNFGKEFNEWFNDRFALRKELISVNSFLSCTLNQICETKTGKLYKQFNITTDVAYLGLTKERYNSGDEIVYAENLSKFNEYCNKNKIKLYILIVPRRADFFNYKFPDITTPESDKGEEIIEYIKQNTDVKIVFPKQAMLEANKQTPVFYKTDHHYSKKGAYVCYRELMKTVQKDFPNVKILEESTMTTYYDKRVKYWWNAEFTEGQGLMQLKLPKFINKKVLDTDFLYYKNPDESKMQTGSFTPLKDLCGFDEEFYYPDGSNLRTMLIANSFGRNLVEFLPYSFKHTIRLYDNYRNLNFYTYEPLIKAYKPDIIIMNFSTVYMPKLTGMYDNNDKEK
ncbi:hypothetical protein IKE67_09330 [bacterium]|nr:hypothetical protein [bacterium]